jgi:hypothetical protein
MDEGSSEKKTGGFSDQQISGRHPNRPAYGPPSRLPSRAAVPFNNCGTDESGTEGDYSASDSGPSTFFNFLVNSFLGIKTLCWQPIHLIRMSMPIRMIFQRFVPHG